MFKINLNKKTLFDITKFLIIAELLMSCAGQGTRNPVKHTPQALTPQTPQTDNTEDAQNNNDTKTDNLSKAELVAKVSAAKALLLDFKNHTTLENRAAFSTLYQYKPSELFQELGEEIDGTKFSYTRYTFQTEGLIVHLYNGKVTNVEANIAPTPIKSNTSGSPVLDPQIADSFGPQREYFIKQNLTIITWERTKILLLDQAVTSVKQYHTGWLTILCNDGTRYLTKQPELDIIFEFVKNNKLEAVHFASE